MRYNKNKVLYREIVRILSDSNGMKFGELNRELERSCEEKYEYKRLSNLLYRKVGKGELQRDEEGGIQHKRRQRRYREKCR